MASRLNGRPRRLVLVLAAFLTACQAADPQGQAEDGELEDLGISEQSARVTPDQAEQAAVIVDSTRDYLPFAYTADGCYARALYMSMELASRRIPSSAQYLSGVLQPSASVAWRWHVAPMVEVDGSSERTILDPSLAPGGPIPLSEWVRLSNPTGRYQLTWTPGSVYFNDQTARRNSEEAPVIQSFAQLVPFKVENITSACATLHRYLDHEASPTRADKQSLLLGRTRTLVNRLQKLGKLKGYSPGANLSCRPREVPHCREPGGPCTSASDCCSLLCSSSGSCQARPVDQATAGAGADGGTLEGGSAPPPCGLGRYCAGSPLTGAAACRARGVIYCCPPGEVIVSGACSPPPTCGTSLSCGVEPLSGASPCRQPGATRSVYCCPSGQAVVDGGCR